MGLTYQRAIRALERYGHHAALSMVGSMLASAILDFDSCATNASHCHFVLEIDPFTREPKWAPWAPHDGYGPMLLAFLEFTALRVGVVPRPLDASMGPLRSFGNATLLWSGLPSLDSSNTKSVYRNANNNNNSNSNYSSNSNRKNGNGNGNGNVRAPLHNYTQTVGKTSFTLLLNATKMVGLVNNVMVFECDAGLLQIFICCFGWFSRFF